MKVFQENKKIILVAEPEVKPTKLFVNVSPEVTDRAVEASREIDESKLKKFLHDLGIK